VPVSGTVGLVVLTAFFLLLAECPTPEQIHTAIFAMPFAKGDANQGALLMRGLENVRAEFGLTALVYNLRRAINILGVDAMMAAVRG
jgi:hypothetical protein